VSEGARVWLIPDGFIPQESSGEQESHEALCVLNTSAEEAWLSISFYFEDRGPVRDVEVVVRSRPETGGIVHTHARYSTTLACLNWEITPIHYMLAVLSDEGKVPIAHYATYGTEELARNAAQALGASHRACLLRNHGTIAVGSSVSEAYSQTELLEEMAEVYYRARLAGEPVLLTAEQLDEVSAKIHDYGQSKPSPAE
jgi:Class II Aldolase and Adducin N-terminal domain/Anabaena sensory rhodopsin transducer